MIYWYVDMYIVKQTYTYLILSDTYSGMLNVLFFYIAISACSQGTIMQYKYEF